MRALIVATAVVLASCTSQAERMNSDPIAEMREMGLDDNAIERVRLRITSQSDVDAIRRRGARQATDATRISFDSDPAQTLEDIGVPVDRFKGVATALYLAWRTEYPQLAADDDRKAAPKPCPAAVQPPPQIVYVPQPAPPVPALDDSSGWWCSRTNLGPSISVCFSRQSRCDEWRQHRSEILSGSSTSNFGTVECTSQDVAACYSVKDLLNKAPDQFCKPTISECKSDRADTMKRARDDYEVTGDCKPSKP